MISNLIQFITIPIITCLGIFCLSRVLYLKNEKQHFKRMKKIIKERELKEEYYAKRVTKGLEALQYQQYDH